MVGLGDRDSHALLRAQGIEDSVIEAVAARCHELYEGRTQTGLPLRPGIPELLELLKAHAVPRAVATTTRQPRANRKLAAAGLLPYFDAVITSGDVARPKPAPDIYLLAAQRLGQVPGAAGAGRLTRWHARGIGRWHDRDPVPDLVHPDEELRALGHRIVGSLVDAHALLLPLLPK